MADNLDMYCWEFAANWIWKNPNGAKLLQEIRGQKVAIYGSTDFVDYLNEWIFPQQKSVLIEQLNYYDYELPEKYKDYPQYNF